MISIRCSKAKDWLTCSKMAEYHDAFPETKDAEHVGAYTGTQLHARVTLEAVSNPRFLQFDEVTRTLSEMQRQVDGMERVVRRALAERGLVIVERGVSLRAEVTIGDLTILVTGTVDLLCQDVDGHWVLIDLKTGKHPPQQTFVQLALYGWLAFWCGYRVATIAYLWVGRKAPHKYEYDARDAETLQDEALDILRQRAAIHRIGVAATPGPHCRRCRVGDCALRDGARPDESKRKLVRI